MINTHRDKPYYDAKSIGSLESLSETLDIRKSALLDLASNPDKHYYSFELKTKKKTRLLHDPKDFLKKIQKRINSRIFNHVIFPDYLHGGLPGKDYYSNALSHTKSEYIITFDIRSFYDNISREEVVKIFQFFCRFPLDVSETLSYLMTFKGKVPQGGVNSSNIANLIFFETEYQLVSFYRNQNITYSRLLDDIVLSSKKRLHEQKKTQICQDISGLVRKKGLRLNKDKFKFVCRKQTDELMNVTGLWVNHAKPKCSREERKKIRAAVNHCEKAFEVSYTDSSYHKLWNKTSGRVAMLARIGHPQAIKLRKRLNCILPVFSLSKIQEIKREVEGLENLSNKKKQKLGSIKKINRMIYLCGIINRSNKNLGKKLRKRLVDIKVVKSYDEYWES
ncbi:reverse transcriptase family protein [Desulfocicer niacini]